MQASEHGHAEVVKLLVAAGAEIDRRTWVSMCEMTPAQIIVSQFVPIAGFVDRSVRAQSGSTAWPRRDREVAAGVLFRKWDLSGEHTKLLWKKNLIFGRNPAVIEIRRAKWDSCRIQKHW
jgi:ankyrin repeat protein